MKLRFFASLALFASLCSAIACSAGADDKGSKTTNPGSGSNSGTGATGNGPDLGPTAGTLNIDVGDGPTMADPNDARDVPVRKKVCDATNTKCTCLRLALLGTLDSAAAQKDTQPFIDWLNGNSDGTATVTMVNVKPTLNDEWLANYDILLVANVNGWAFSADEKAAVEKWNKVGGGGIIALTGFVSTASEPADTSQLIGFSGISFNSTIAAKEKEAQTKPVYYKGGTVDLKECLSWNGGNDPVITAPVKFTAQTGTLAKLTLSLDYVGAFMGFAVTAPAGATTVATDPVSGQPMAVAMEVDGKGRVLAFGDEWVIFKNQWEPTGKPYNMTMDVNNKCWQPGDGTNPGFFQSVKSLYQTKQFWFDVINWVAPPNECNFVVRDDDVVVK